MKFAEKQSSKYWIDAVKAICMLSVYLCHSEIYSNGDVHMCYALQGFYVNAFFVMSGYLLFWKMLDQKTELGSEYFKKKMANLATKLILPSIIFGVLLYIPKSLFHKGGLDLPSVLFNTLGGMNYWFISALVVAEIAVLAIGCTCKWKNIWTYAAPILIVSAAGGYLCHLNTQTTLESHFPWFYKTGMVYTLFLLLGGLLNRYEEEYDRAMKYLFLPLLALTIYILLSTWQDKSALCFGLGGDFNIAGLVLSLCSISTVVTFCKKLDENKLLAFIGRNSIVFYFLSGALPASLSTAVKPECIKYGNLLFIVVAIVSTAIAFIATKLILKYAPFILGMQKKK